MNIAPIFGQAVRHFHDGGTELIAATQSKIDVGFSPAADLASTPAIAPDPFKPG